MQGKSRPANKVSCYLRTIQEHIHQGTHPIGILIRAFKKAFTKENCYLLFNKDMRFDADSPAPPVNSLRASMAFDNSS